MSRNESWKSFGKNVGKAFKNFGKAMATTAKVVVGDEENKVEEDGRSTLKHVWTDTGKGFGEAGKSLGHAAADTIDGGEKKAPSDMSTEGAVDVEAKDVEPKEEEN